MVIFNGKINDDPENPFEMFHIRTIEGEMFRDTDSMDQESPIEFVTTIELTDEEGNVLWRDRVNSLYQVLLNLEVVLDQTSPIPLTLDQVYRFVSMQYPELLEFGLLIPTHLKQHIHSTRSSNFHRENTFPLDLIGLMN